MRAWEPGIAAGDNGLSVAGELAWAHNVERQTIELYGFVDHAQIRAPGRFVALQSAGISATLALGPALTLRTHYAAGIGRRGIDRDSDRADISATLHF